MAWLEFDMWVWSILSFIVAVVFCWLYSRRGSVRRRRPPGPPGWPLLGNIFDVTTMFHRDMYNLKPKYGPVIWLKLGARNAVVVQSAKVAAELFKKHDVHFASRTVPDSLTACGYNEASLTQASYDDYWRGIRQFFVVEFTAQKRITESAQLRQTCVENMVQWIGEDAGHEIQLDNYLVRMSFNLISSFMLSRDVIDMKSDTANEFFDAMNEFVQWIGKPNLSDAFGFLRGIDPQGIRRNTERHLKRLIRLVDRFVKERVQDRERGRPTETRDVLDALLDYNGKGSENLSAKNKTLLILEMFLAGSETTSSTIEWTIAELLKNPEAMKILKAELDQVVGISRPVGENDLGELPYLQAVVKESMRLNPAVPLLLQRKAIEDTEFLGYLIPKNTAVIVNAWAIHRDQDSWQDPLLFKPDRFLNSDIDSKGQNFELIPFGSGRRSCIGMALGQRMVSLSVARLVQAFDWELPGSGGPEKLDMTERLGISLKKLHPLRAIPRWRKA